jgi:hypothetical protein
LSATCGAQGWWLRLHLDGESSVWCAVTDRRRRSGAAVVLNLAGSLGLHAQCASVARAVDSPVRTSALANESGLARAACGDLTRVVGTRGTGLRRAVGRSV